MRWPRCGFVFFTHSAPDVPKVWRKCNRAWGHWLQPMPKGKHEGPMTDAPRR